MAMIVATTTMLAAGVAGNHHQQSHATWLDACQMLLSCKHNLGDKWQSCKDGQSVLLTMHTTDWYSLSGLLPSSHQAACLAVAACCSWGLPGATWLEAQWLLLSCS